MMEQTRVCVIVSDYYSNCCVVQYICLYGNGRTVVYTISHRVWPLTFLWHILDMVLSSCNIRTPNASKLNAHRMLLHRFNWIRFLIKVTIDGSFWLNRGWSWVIAILAIMCALLLCFLSDYFRCTRLLSLKYFYIYIHVLMCNIIDKLIQKTCSGLLIALKYVSPQQSKQIILEQYIYKKIIWWISTFKGKVILINDLINCAWNHYRDWIKYILI